VGVTSAHSLMKEMRFSPILLIHIVCINEEQKGPIAHNLEKHSTIMKKNL
jgi:hypothetical protein